MPDESHESLEAVRMEKGQRIAELRFDPCGEWFDGHQVISAVRTAGTG